MSSTDENEVCFLGLDSLRADDLGEEDVSLLRGAQAVVVPGGRVGGLVSEMLRAAGDIRGVQQVSSCEEFVSRRPAVYCSVGAVIPYDPVAWNMYKTLAPDAQVHIRQPQPLSRRLQSSASMPVAGDFASGTENAEVLGPHQLESYVGSAGDLWVEGLWLRQYRSAAILAVSRLYCPSHPAWLIDAVDILNCPAVDSYDHIEKEQMTVAELPDRLASATLPLLYLPASQLAAERTRDAVRAGQAMCRLFEVIHRLRAPGGCPWDRQQDHQSLTPFLLEECHELIDAIDKESSEQLSEELGDVLLQVLLHSVIAFESGEFSFEAVMQALTDKMVFRHPHVFADVRAETESEVERNWEQLKRQKREHQDDELKSAVSALSGVPGTLPALLQAEKVQRVASQVGFDWPDISGPLDKISEELDELTAAMHQGRKDQIREEFGDLLFALVNVARFLDLSPELQLRRTVGKFRKRFAAIERHASSAGRRMENLSLEEMDRIWNKYKENGQ